MPQCSTASAHYTVKFTVYNLTDQHNLTNDMPFYGNDFITRQPPRVRLESQRQILGAWMRRVRRDPSAYIQG